MDDSITLSEESDKVNNGENDFFNINKKIKSENIKTKNELLSPENIKVTKFETNDEYKGLNKKNTEIMKLINSIRSSIKGKKSKEISLRESLKNEDYDYLKSIIVKKQSKIDYEKTFENIYEQRENYEEEQNKPLMKKKIIRLKIVRKKEENINENLHKDNDNSTKDNINTNNNIFIRDKNKNENEIIYKNNNNEENKDLEQKKNNDINALISKENCKKNIEDEDKKNSKNDINEIGNNIKDIILINDNDDNTDDNIINDLIKNVDKDNEIGILEKKDSINNKNENNNNDIMNEEKDKEKLVSNFNINDIKIRTNKEELKDKIKNIKSNTKENDLT